jgi:hypothetical protein
VGLGNIKIRGVSDKKGILAANANMGPPSNISRIGIASSTITSGFFPQRI